MGWKQKVGGGFLAALGFMLSPLSWWNDVFVNLPLALAFAWLVSLPCGPELRERVFQVSVVVGYWLTNVLGFVLMHKGVRALLSPEARSSTRRELTKDIVVSLAYTTLIVVLIKFGVLKPISDYFSNL